MCVCVWVSVRVRVRDHVSKWERDREKQSVCVHVCMPTHVCVEEKGQKERANTPPPHKKTKKDKNQLGLQSSYKL